MDQNNQLNEFINAITETKKVWLLQAMPGMFAMLEDKNGNSYVPLWSSESDAKNAATEDWANYFIEYMDFPELESWLRELGNDQINIAVSPDEEGKIIALNALDFRKWVKNYVVKPFKEEGEDDEDDLEDLYGDGWAEEWPEEK
jgi:Protein of unknown function (DUF2750).